MDKILNSIKSYFVSVCDGDKKAVKSFALGLFVFFVILYCILLLFKIQSNTLGTVGDYFGGMLNPIFAFLSLLAILKTISIQSEELKLTRQELEMTREELAKSAEAQKQSSEIFRQQRFENTFFSLLDTINSTISIFNEGKKEINSINLLDFYWGTNFSKVSILIYQLLKLTDSYSNDYKINKQYSNILRACLDDELLQRLAKHCKNDDKSFDTYVALIRKYAFFEHMQTNPGKDILNHYDDEAFGKNIYLEEWKK